jgi:hypothetical protein
VSRFVRGVGGMWGTYLGAIYPCVGPETDGVAEGEEEDEDDACVI